MNMHVRERERCAREFTMVETGGLRARLEHTIEALIVLLDAIDGDADLEPTFGELDPDGIDEAEEDDPLEEDADREPWLGSLEFYPLLAPCYGPGWDQHRWGFSGRSDRECDAGDEPEYDEADWGIADLDALRLVEAAGLPPISALWQR